MTHPAPETAPNQGRIPVEVWILVSASFVIAIGYGIVAPVLPAYAKSFDVGVAAASVIVSIFAAFRLVFAPLGGVLSEKLGERPVYIAGLLIVALSSLATAFAQNYWQLLIFRGLGGVGSTMFTISAMALLVRLAPPGVRGRVSALWGGTFILGGMVGPLVGGLVAGWGMRAPFVIYAVALFVAAAVVTVGLGGARLRPAPEAADRPVMTLTQAWADPAYRAALVAGIANGWSNLGVRNAILPLFAVTIFDRTWTAGLVLALGALGTALTLTLGGSWADEVGRRPLIIAGMAITGVTTACFGLTSLLPASAALVGLLALSLIAGLGAGLVNPAAQAAMADIIGADRAGGRVLSTYQMAQDVGVIVGPIAIGALIDVMNYEVGFAVAGLVTLIGAAAWFAAPETLHRTRPPVPAH